MKTSIDTSFTTGQNDAFKSGLVKEIGGTAYTVWMAIKSHANYADGKASPGMRELAEETGLAVNTVSRAVHALVGARLLRIVKEGGRGRGQTYIPRERLEVRLGDRVVCTVVIDYVPATMRDKLKRIGEVVNGHMSDPKAVAEAFAEVEIIIGKDFVLDPVTGTYRASIPIAELVDDGPVQITPETGHLLFDMLPDDFVDKLLPRVPKK